MYRNLSSQHGNSQNYTTERTTSSLIKTHVKKEKPRINGKNHPVRVHAHGHPSRGGEYRGV